MRIGKKQVKGLYGDAWVKVYDQVTGPALHANTVLYLQGDTLVDYTGKTVTVGGSAAVSLINPKFPELYRCMAFGGTTDYLSLADSADWDFGTGPYTVDFWMRQNKPADYYVYCIGNRGATSGGSPWNYWYVEKFPDRPGYCNINFGIYGTAGNYYPIQSRSLIPDDTFWHHYAFVRAGTGSDQSYVFFDGKNITAPGQGTDPNNYTNAVGPLYIAGGVGLPTNEFINGALSGVRITKGAALWTSDFTPDTHPPGPMTFYQIGWEGSLGYANTNAKVNGNIDEEYRLLTRYVNGYNGVSQLWLRFNNDSGTNYGYQRIYGQSSTVTATQVTATTQITLAAGNSIGNSSLADTLIYAKSGYPRTALTTVMTGAGATSVDTIQKFGYVWNNTADEITSMFFRSDQNYGIGPGTSFELWKKVDKI